MMFKPHRVNTTWKAEFGVKKFSQANRIGARAAGGRARAHGDDAAGLAEPLGNRPAVAPAP